MEIKITKKKKNHTQLITTFIELRIITKQSKWVNNIC